jgi:hypothetical protein
VIVVGAGPAGLSAALHLQASCFGRCAQPGPIRGWHHSMPVQPAGAAACWHIRPAC